jgi:integrase
MTAAPAAAQLAAQALSAGTSRPDRDAWPGPDTMVLRARPLRAGADPARLPRFADAIWHLQAAHPDVHAVAATLCWDPFPEPLTTAFKTFALAALDHPYPVDPTVGRPGDRPAVTTIALWVRDLRVFACWLHERGITPLSQATAADLDAYHRHVAALACSADRQGRLLATVRTLWSYQIHLPEPARLSPDPWDGAGGARKAGRSPSPTNKTPRISAATMETLLAWSLTMVERIGEDIIAARTDYQRLDAGTHPTQAAYRHLGPTDRVRAFADQARRAGATIPGRPGRGEPTINWSHLARLLHLHPAALGRPDLRRMLSESGLGIAPDSFLGSITARIDGRPWRDQPITVTELPTLARLLSAASFVVIAYLSGMRPGEVLNLRRGCADRDTGTGELLVRGQLGKGHDRLPAADGQPAGRPWVVVAPVHTAISVLERITSGELLFPASLTRPRSRRTTGEQARPAHSVNVDIEDFIIWVNRGFGGPDGIPAIPADPAGHIHASRLRRTLAYFIVRRPRGLIAAALQYAHVHTKVTLGYSGIADTSWLDDLAVERLEMVLDQTDQDAALLEKGEHVSGCSAADYTTRVQRAARFAGRTITQVRNVDRLLASADPAIHHGDGMTCVWRAETAACRKARIAEGLPHTDGPEESECVSTCANLAYTDRDIARLQDRHQAMTAAATDPLAPKPLRERTSLIAGQLQVIIDRHEQTRPATPPRHRGDPPTDEPPTP